MPRFLDLLTGQAKEHQLVQEIFTRIMSPLTKGSLSPTELLVTIHAFENKIGVRKTIEGKIHLPV
jgi:hypothetical protein